MNGNTKLRLNWKSVFHISEFCHSESNSSLCETLIAVDHLIGFTVSSDSYIELFDSLSSISFDYESQSKRIELNYIWTISWTVYRYCHSFDSFVCCIWCNSNYLSNFHCYFQFLSQSWCHIAIDFRQILSVGSVIPHMITIIHIHQILLIRLWDNNG
jgi:hypothetical protein